MNALFVGCYKKIRALLATRTYSERRLKLNLLLERLIRSETAALQVYYLCL